MFCQIEYSIFLPRQPLFLQSMPASGSLFFLQSYNHIVTVIRLALACPSVGPYCPPLSLSYGACIYRGSLVQLVPQSVPVGPHCPPLSLSYGACIYRGKQSSLACSSVSASGSLLPPPLPLTQVSIYYVVSCVFTKVAQLQLVLESVSASGSSLPPSPSLKLNMQASMVSCVCFSLAPFVYMRWPCSSYYDVTGRPLHVHI